MIDIDKWQEIFHTLKQNRLRTALTAFGIFWGVFMLVIMLGAGSGLENAVYSNMGDFAKNSMFIWAQHTTMPYKGFPRNRSYHFEYSDKYALEENIPEIEIIAPTVNGGGYRQTTLVVHGLKKGEFNVLGKTPQENNIDPVDIAWGRFLNEYDLLERRKSVLLGYRVYEELFDKGEDPVNKYVRINGIYFQVIGVYKSKHSGGWGENQNSEIWIPFSTAQQVYNYPNKVDHFSIVVKPEYEVKQVEGKVMAILAKRHNLHPEDKAAFGYNNVGEEFKKMNGLFLGIRGLIWIVGIGTLLAGIIGVSNIMLIILRERTVEFGIKRAIGATPKKIVMSVLSESVFLTLIAGLVGLMFGVFIIELVNSVIPPDSEMFRNPEVDFKLAVSALIIIIISGMLAGVIPSRRVVSIKPIEAIRSEQ
ncbi:MAG TPA: ABC transporter ATP-binding protein [Bacteroidales bacterium]|jgi:putative ABC transport system permease protein|nr:ABC transporter ATP-binding protein [Bacteroidales bacterium]